MKTCPPITISLLTFSPNHNSDVPTLRLIDFGCAIDMKFFNPKTQFKKVSFWWIVMTIWNFQFRPLILWILHVLYSSLVRRWFKRMASLALRCWKVGCGHIKLTSFVWLERCTSCFSVTICKWWKNSAYTKSNKSCHGKYFETSIFVSEYFWELCVMWNINFVISQVPEKTHLDRILFHIFEYKRCA